MQIKKFQKIVRAYYKKHKRNFLWRRTRDPYKIFVSEIMLQQTQASRVEPKYKSFLAKFPTVHSLARAPLSAVLREWQGLGYNRRALFLKQTAQKIEKDFKGKFPKDFALLSSLPGIGPTTAGDILIFTFNIPVVVIETNIRSVFIHFFFKRYGEKKKVTDKEIRPLIERTLDHKNPREWYSALLDYGAYLKQTENPSRRSAHHTTQSPFTGSRRQKRAQILKLILIEPRTAKNISTALHLDRALVLEILSDLQQEKFIRKTKGGRYTILEA